MASLRKRGARYYVRVRDENGKLVEKAAGTDRSMALRMAAELESRYLAIKAGAISADEAGFAEAQRRKLSDHVTDYVEYQRNQGLAPRYVVQINQRLRWFVAEFRVDRMAALNRENVMRALRRLADKGRSDRTVHQRARTAKAFSHWLWAAGRLREDPLARLEPPKVVNFDRRSALSNDEARKLIGSTPDLPFHHGMTGPDRAMLYALALGTGLRRGELASLRPEDFDLADVPSVTCRAGYTKNRTEAVQPIHPGLADLFRPWLEGKPEGKPVFPGLANIKTGLMTKVDLKALGISTEGRDFHALRHTYITTLALSNTPPAITQRLARHSDPRLTFAVYTHIGLTDTSRHLESLSHNLPTDSDAKRHKGSA